MYRIGTYNVLHLCCIINHIWNIAKNSKTASLVKPNFVVERKIVSISFDYYEDQSQIMKSLTRYQIHPVNLFFFWLRELPIIRLINYYKKENWYSRWCGRAPSLSLSSGPTNEYSRQLPSDLCRSKNQNRQRRPIKRGNMRSNGSDRSQGFI